MSMTREEAIKRLKELKARCERLSVSSNYTPQKWREDAEAVRMALSVLRPVSREQVEQACKSKWIQMNNTQEHYCESCGVAFNLYAYCKNDYRFCPFCGAPMTDEAVEMVMERLEALHEDNSCS